MFKSKSASLAPPRQIIKGMRICLVVYNFTACFTRPGLQRRAGGHQMNFQSHSTMSFANRLSTNKGPHLTSPVEFYALSYLLTGLRPQPRGIAMFGSYVGFSAFHTLASTVRLRGRRAAKYFIASQAPIVGVNLNLPILSPMLYVPSCGEHCQGLPFFNGLFGGQPAPVILFGRHTKLEFLGRI